MTSDERAAPRGKNSPLNPAASANKRSAAADEKAVAESASPSVGEDGQHASSTPGSATSAGRSTQTGAGGPDVLPIERRAARVAIGFVRDIMKVQLGVFATEEQIDRNALSRFMGGNDLSRQNFERLRGALVRRIRESPRFNDYRDLIGPAYEQLRGAGDQTLSAPLQQQRGFFRFLTDDEQPALQAERHLPKIEGAWDIYRVSSSDEAITQRDGEVVVDPKLKLSRSFLSIEPRQPADQEMPKFDLKAAPTPEVIQPIHINGRIACFEGFMQFIGAPHGHGGFALMVWRSPLLAPGETLASVASGLMTTMNSEFQPVSAPMLAIRIPQKPGFPINEFNEIKRERVEALGHVTVKALQETNSIGERLLKSFLSRHVRAAYKI